MRKILSAIQFVSGLFGKKQSSESQAGKGPYSNIDADDGTTWNIYKRSGKTYAY